MRRPSAEREEKGNFPIRPSSVFVDRTNFECKIPLLKKENLSNEKKPFLLLHKVSTSLIIPLHHI